jgi:hypothetical protein
MDDLPDVVLVPTILRRFDKLVARLDGRLNSACRLAAGCGPAPRPSTGISAPSLKDMIGTPVAWTLRLSLFEGLEPDRARTID